MQFFIPDRCPKCGAEGRVVRYENLLANLRSIEGVDAAKEYRYCTNEACDVIYFSGTQTFTNDQLLRKSAAKCSDPDATICYCFDYKVADASEEAFEEYKAKNAQGCACGVRNPSGKCCSKIFKRYLSERA